MLWGSKKQLTCSCQITIKEIKAFCTPLHFCYISDWFYYHFLPRNESLRYGNFTVDLFKIKKKICLYILNAYYYQLCTFCMLIFIRVAYSYQVFTNCMLILQVCTLCKVIHIRLTIMDDLDGKSQHAYSFFVYKSLI